jgi:hypothetical protein
MADAIRRRYARLTGPDLGADVDDERELHIQLLAERYARQGLPPHEARAMAMHEFGDRDGAREACLEIDRTQLRSSRRHEWWRGLWADLRHGARRLRKSPGSSRSRRPGDQLRGRRRRAATPATSSAPEPTSQTVAGSGTTDALMSSIAKSGAVDDSTTLLNAAPANVMLASGKRNPGGTVPGALTLPTIVTPLSAWSMSEPGANGELRPNRSEIPVSGALNVIVSGPAVASLSISTRPASVANGDGCTMKPTGELNVAVSPPLVTESGTVVKLGVVSKSIVCAAADELTAAIVAAVIVASRNAGPDLMSALPWLGTRCHP